MAIGMMGGKLPLEGVDDEAAPHKDHDDEDEGDGESGNESDGTQPEEVSLSHFVKSNRFDFKVCPLYIKCNNQIMTLDLINFSRPSLQHTPCSPVKFWDFYNYCFIIYVL